MTLCIVWRSGINIMIATDSRLTGGGYTLDCAVKVLRVPYNIYAPTDAAGQRQLITSGDIGMAASGSMIGALCLKESLVEAMLSIQVVPDTAPVSMARIANYMFAAYKVIAEPIYHQVGAQAHTNILITGYCDEDKMLRAFRMGPDETGHISLWEVLRETRMEIFGSGAAAARQLIGEAPADQDILRALHRVIKDDSVPGVGGNIQVGWQSAKKFQTAGVMIQGEDVHYWRSCLDLNAREFMDTGLIPNLPFVIIHPQEAE